MTKRMWLTGPFVSVGLLILVLVGSPPSMPLSLWGGAAIELALAEQARYGGIEKTPEMQRADTALKASVAAQGLTLVQGAEAAFQKGLEALNTADYGLAMRCFNQGWVLNPNNARVYSGFGIVAFVRDNDFTAAQAHFEQARALEPRDLGIKISYARVLEESNHTYEAIALYEEVLAEDPTIPLVYVGLIRAYGKADNIERSLYFAREGRRRGAQITDIFIERMEQLQAIRSANG